MRNALQTIDAHTTFESDRRNERWTLERSKISLPVHIRSIDPSEHAILEAANTLDVNRHGLCFSTSREHYQVGMSLCLTFPYSSPVTVRKEFVGNVVRVDSLPNGRRSVAVQFLSQDRS
jgi:5-formaminoimidazole-4-carboxamide-1-beta-D-ribofuranosyl 5'-monophosphate synthetase